MKCKVYHHKNNKGLSKVAIAIGNVRIYSNLEASNQLAPNQAGKRSELCSKAHVHSSGKWKRSCGLFEGVDEGKILSLSEGGEFSI